MAKQKVGLLFGGCSGEHEVSISSAKAIASLKQHQQLSRLGDFGEFGSSR